MGVGKLGGVSDALFDSLFAALAASPDNTELRVQVARLLLDRGRLDEAVTQAATALAQEPGNTEAMAVLTQATGRMRAAIPGAAMDPRDDATGTTIPSEYTEPRDEFSSSPERAEQASLPDTHGTFDWKQAETDFGESPVPPPYVASTPAPDGPSVSDAPLPITPGGDDAAPVIDEYQNSVTLADVGGLEPVKQRLRESFLEPMKHPELAKAFGKNLRGGLVLYGPPGCGKTFMARAIAGELGARFLTASLADILGSHFGETEKNLRALFQHARSLTPAVLFLDEIDAIGAKRSSIGTGWSGMRAMVDQLLMELDSMSADNDGLFVLAATNSPWEVDPALLRPGRFDRMLLVLPPDEPAREAILRMHLDRRPVAGIDLGELVRSTDGFSGADLEHLVASAAEQAMLRSIQSGQVQPIGMDELRHVLREIKPSTGPWLSGAKNVVAFANTDGRYDDLAAFLDARGIR